MLLLQSLTTSLSLGHGSECGEEPQSWRVPLMVLAGLCALSSSVFVLLFRSPYRRIKAEQLARAGPATVTSDLVPESYSREDPPPLTRCSSTSHQGP
uniref:Uncharacterized protein n=1 Tax=Knipowitschia caucasica TaxID=637954 RepID=A0AAV2MIA0_KNICA